MTIRRLFRATLLAVLAIASGVRAAPVTPATSNHCTIQDNNSGNVKQGNKDALFAILTSQPRCPENVFGLRQLLQSKGLKLHPAFVNDRGYANPLPAGSYSFFEGVTGKYEGGTLAFGEFFFGHFTEADDQSSILSPQQEANPNALMIELIVWDPGKQMYNFYEERGTGQGGLFFYRGDSADIMADIAAVNRNTDPTKPLFGSTLRCSGCHMNGGPLMKELAFPHDSWWRKDRPLPLGGMVIAPQLAPILPEVVDASEFSAWIDAGYKKLFASPGFRQARDKTTLQEQLRPIFCEQELNLESDTEPFTGAATGVKVPLGFFVDPRLLPAGTEPVVVGKALYTNALNVFGASFVDGTVGPRPTDSLDADHAWETPVKAYSDIRIADMLVEQKIVDREFIADVLAVDMTRPMFSDARCKLLQLVPSAATPTWKADFQKALAASPAPAAKELLANLTDRSRNAELFQKQAAALLTKVRARANDPAYVTSLVRLLAQKRIEAMNAQISQNPKGQILEPDFRLIFPTFSLLAKDQKDVNFGGLPGQYWLNPTTASVELSPLQ